MDASSGNREISAGQASIYIPDDINKPIYLTHLNFLKILFPLYSKIFLKSIGVIHSLNLKI